MPFFDFIVNAIQNGPVTEEEIAITEWFAEYIYLRRLYLIEQAINVYYVWNSVNQIMTSASALGTIFGAVNAPPDFTGLVAETFKGSNVATMLLTVQATRVSLAAILQKGEQSIKNLEVPVDNQPPSTSAMGQQLAENVHTLADTTVEESSSTVSDLMTSITELLSDLSTLLDSITTVLSMLAFPVVIALAAIDIIVTELFEIVSINGALDSLKSAATSIGNDVVTVQSLHQVLNNVTNTDKSNLYQEMISAFVQAVDVKDTDTPSPLDPSFLPLMHNRFDSLVRYTVTCRFTVDNVLDEIYLNGISLMPKMSIGNSSLDNWQVSKTLSFLEPYYLESVMSFKVNDATPSSAPTISGMIISCVSENANSAWNFVSEVDYTWTSIGSLSATEDNFASGWDSNSYLPNEAGVAVSTSGFTLLLRYLRRQEFGEIKFRNTSFYENVSVLITTYQLLLVKFSVLVGLVICLLAIKT